ncbi:MAG: dihydroorotate dehydrogenase electron transfer subunit [Candidatus Thermoplasmatota archaeon]|nr:dihydroorotate dehydrogenase electron transfer subunit [Candidatus Thermoplasmatota archaeon]
MNYPLVTKIIETKNENNRIKTIKFENNKKITPGQFYMIWIPGVDEIPMSVSYIDKNIIGITFKKIGEATNALFNLKKGDKIGARGPYGTGFKLNGKKILFVGGGTGVAMLAPVIEEAIKKKLNLKVIIGAKTKNELFFEKRIKETGAELFISTDDGTYGTKGFTTDIAEDIIKKNHFDLILTCGPELMMKKLMDISKDIDFQASLERFMKCGFGICGQCCIGDGIRVCTEGPIFNEKTLKKIQDFGIFKRDASGKKIKF